MRLAGYIIDEGRSSQLSEDDAIYELRKYCAKSIRAWNAWYRIYRGIKSIGQFRYIDPSKSVRMSRNTNNLYTLVMDNSPSWKRYPKRSKSIICATSVRGAAAYGDPYSILTRDGANYGLCSKNDIWGSFDTTIGYGMQDFNWDFLVVIGEKMLGMTGNENVSSFGELKKICAEMDKRYLDESRHGMSVGDIRARYTWMDRYDGNFLKLLQTLISPDINGFQNIKDPMKIPSGGNYEVWTDSPSYMIKEEWLNLNIDKVTG